LEKPRQELVRTLREWEGGVWPRTCPISWYAERSAMQHGEKQFQGRQWPLDSHVPIFLCPQCWWRAGGRGRMELAVSAARPGHLHSDGQGNTFTLMARETCPL